MSKSKYQFYQEASLSQKLADKIPLYQKVAGSDPETSRSIAVLITMVRLQIIPLNSEVKVTLAVLDALRMANFATSEKTNEITKMGMQMPKGEDIISSFGE